MLTDVFGGNSRSIYNYGCSSKRTDGFITKFNRLIERRLLRHFSKKGYITWEEEIDCLNIKMCVGCGAPLQSEDKNKPGFVPEHNMFRDDVICRRCCPRLEKL